MAPKLVDCEHCGGKKMCTKSGGRSCRACMEAAGMGKRAWATVRCSYCGGRGKVLASEPEPEEQQPTNEDKEGTDAE